MRYVDLQWIASLLILENARWRNEANTAKGIGVHKRQAEIITEDDEEILWQKGLLGDHSPLALLNTVFFMCGLFVALRSGHEHRQLRLNPPQITIHEQCAVPYMLCNRRKL